MVDGVATQNLSVGDSDDEFQAYNTLPGERTLFLFLSLSLTISLSLTHSLTLLFYTSHQSEQHANCRC